MNSESQAPKKIPTQTKIFQGKAILVGIGQVKGTYSVVILRNIKSIS